MLYLGKEAYKRKRPCNRAHVERFLLTERELKKKEGNGGDWAPIAPNTAVGLTLEKHFNVK